MACNFNNMNYEILMSLFSYLKLRNLKKNSLVCKRWNLVANEVSVIVNFIFHEFAFTPFDWNTYANLKVSSKESELAYNLLLKSKIAKILKSDNHSFPGERFIDSHMLVWIPENMNLNSFGELLKQKENFSNNKNGFRFITDKLYKNVGSKSLESGWVLMAKKVIEVSLNQPFKLAIEALNSHDESKWRVPKISEAAICISAIYLKTEKFLFNEEPLIYTYCQETVDKHQAIVGGFQRTGLHILDSSSKPRMGVAPLWKLT